MMDTDSFFIKIKCKRDSDVYDWMIKNNNLFDLSNCEKGPMFEKIKNHCEKENLNLKDFLNENKAVVGKMKNEVANSEIIEAVSVKAKCYDYVTIDDKCHKKLKGIKKYAVD